METDRKSLLAGDSIGNGRPISASAAYQTTTPRGKAGLLSVGVCMLVLALLLIRCRTPVGEEEAGSK